MSSFTVLELDTCLVSSYVIDMWINDIYHFTLTYVYLACSYGDKLCLYLSSMVYFVTYYHIVFNSHLLCLLCLIYLCT
jgi:hypothetical protein